MAFPSALLPRPESRELPGWLPPHTPQEMVLVSPASSASPGHISSLPPAASQAFPPGHHEASFLLTVHLTRPRPSSCLDLDCLNSPSSPPLDSLPPVPPALIHLCCTTKGIYPTCTSVLLFSYLKRWKDFLLPTRLVLELLRNRVSRNHLGTLFKCSFGASLVVQW